MCGNWALGILCGPYPFHGPPCASGAWLALPRAISPPETCNALVNARLPIFHMVFCIFRSENAKNHMKNRQSGVNKGVTCLRRADSPRQRQPCTTCAWRPMEWVRPTQNSQGPVSTQGPISSGNMVPPPQKISSDSAESVILYGFI